MDQTLIIILNRDETRPGPSRSQILEDLRAIGLREVIDYSVPAVVSKWFQEKYPLVNVDDFMIVETRYTDPYFVEKALSVMNDIDVGYRMIYDSEVNGLYDEDGVYSIHGLKDNLMEALASEYELFKSRNPEAAAKFVKRMQDQFGSPSTSVHKYSDLNALADDINKILCSDVPTVNSTVLSSDEIEELEDQLEVIWNRIADEDSDVVLTSILNILSKMNQDFWIDYAMLMILQ